MGLGFTQDNRLINITTPLGKDVLLLSSITGVEGLSQLFHFTVEMVAENSENVKFEDLLGQPATIEILLHDGGSRYINGIINKVIRKERGLTFTGFTADIVPKLWLLTKASQSRIFQHQNVPDILKKVLSDHGIDLANEIQGTFEKRDYCVQYRETDFAFASRLMEEEGIFYYFKHTKDGHKMVLANTPQSHPDMPHMSDLIYEGDTGGWRPEERIQDWVKTQQLRSGKYTLWDSCFEMPTKSLEAQETVQETVSVGKVNHKLKVANDSLEIYEYPGGYAQRFDGIDKGGGEQSSELQKIFQDNKRTAGIRMQQESVHSLLTYASSNYSNIAAGHKFNLKRHFQDDGTYVVVEVHHDISQGGNYRSSAKQAEEDFKCHNSFTCIPVAIPYRPPLITPRPVIPSTQTAFVVGPAGEEIFTDKYGRVKVQFQWDRTRPFNADSSCWVRVGVPWAGKNWGFVSIPRIGQEVIVSFLEGDPDQPIITGSVYNADHMPPYELAASKTQSAWKSRSTPGGGGFNEIRLEDKKDSEQIFIHGQKNLDVRILNDRMEWVGRDRHMIVKRDKVDLVERDGHANTKRDSVSEVGRDLHVKVKGKEAKEVTGSKSLKVTGDVIEEFKANHSEQVTQNLYLKAMQIVIEATTGITLKVGSNFITIDPSGVAVKGTLIQLNSAGMALSGTPGTLVSPLSVAAPVEADDATPGGHKEYSGGGAAGGGGGGGGGGSSSNGRRSDAPWHDPNSEQSKTKQHWVEIELVDEEGQPVAGEPYELKLPDGTTIDSGSLDEKGRARVDGIDPGTCEVTFPRLDKSAWRRKG